jgi:hypothetical protein
MSKERSRPARDNSADPRREVWRADDTPCGNRRTGYGAGMCRNIRPLFNFEPPASDEEVVSAALQYVRKISGTRKPSAGNLKAFDRAVANIAKATRQLVDTLETKEAPKNREIEAAKARQKNALRFG